MKIIFISDTHGQNISPINIPNGDILIHCGDISSLGGKQQVEEFIDWFTNLPHKHKVFIAGNHEITFDVNKNNGTKPDWLLKLLLNLPYNIHYLENSSITIENINIYGSPISPWFYGERWAFNKHQGNDIKKVWDKIPNDTDILITHCPPFGILDYAKYSRKNVGCEELLIKVNQLKPKIHAFGHIHEGYGTHTNENNITFINASLLNENYEYINQPIEIEYEN